MSDNQLTPVLQHSGRIAMGWGLLLYMIRQGALKAQAAEQTRTDDKLQSYVNARYPVLSLDPSLRDAKTEKKRRGAGVPEFDALPEVDKQADWKETMGEVGGKMKEIANDWLNPLAFLRDETGQYPASFTETIHRLQRGRYDPRHLAFVTAALALGGTAGWKAADRKADLARKEQLTDRVDLRRNEIDKLMFNEYKRINEMPKLAEWISKDAEPKNENVSQASVLGLAANPFKDPKGSVNAAAALAWVYFIGASMVAHSASKKYMDSNDPSRIRQKGLMRIARDKAKVTDAPVLVMDDNRYMQRLMGSAKGRQSPEKAPAGQNIPIDPRDGPGMQQLLEV